jgi:CDP-diacylglycerol--glycerol-3-phosphate 3-phosphatidyltransferase
VTGGTVVSEEPKAAGPGRPRRVGPVPLVNPANALTALRLMLVPVFVALVVASGMTDTGLRLAASLAFFLAAVTDLLDGWIARTWDMVTAFGKVADPIADKALTGTAFVLLSGYDRLPWWVTVLILGREVGVTALRFWVIRHGVIAASRGGKAKTALQSGAILWLLLPLPTRLAWIGWVLVAAALVVTMVTGADYLVRALRLRRAGVKVP